MDIDEWKDRKSFFLSEINEELAPVLQVVCSIGETFDVTLCETKYAMTDQVVTVHAMDELIERLSIKHFTQMPHYNNTHRCFWFSNVGN